MANNTSAGQVSRVTVTFEDLNTVGPGNPFDTGVAIPPNCYMLVSGVNVPTLFAANGDGNSGVAAGVGTDLELIQDRGIPIAETGPTIAGFTCRPCPLAGGNINVTWFANGTDTALTAGQYDVMILWVPLDILPDGEIMKMRVELSKREIVQGDKAIISIYLYDDFDHGRPLDITAWNKYSVSIPYSGGVLEVSETINLNDSIISLVSAPRGELTLTIFPDDTDLLNEGVFDMQVKIDNASPNPQSVILPDGITIRQKVEA